MVSLLLGTGAFALEGARAHPQSTESVQLICSVSTTTAVC